MSTEKGKLITIDGGDATGKQTQAKLLLDRLNESGFPTELISFPTYQTVTGTIIGHCYLGKRRNAYDSGKSWFGDPDSVDPILAAMYYAANRREELPRIEEGLSTGINYVFDRGVEANLLHQAGKEKDPSRRLELAKKLRRLDYEIGGFPQPDRVILLTLPHKISVQRAIERGEALDGHETEDHQRRVEETGLALAEHFGWTVVDCLDYETGKQRIPQEVHEEIYDHVRRMFEE